MIASFGHVITELSLDFSGLNDGAVSESGQTVSVSEVSGESVAVSVVGKSGQSMAAKCVSGWDGGSFQWSGGSDGWSSLVGDGWGSLDDGWCVSDGGVVGDAGVSVSAGLVQGLLISGVGGNWADDWLVPVQLLLLEDGLGDVLGFDDGSWLDGLDGCWGVDVSGLSNWDGPGGQLWGDLGVGVSLGGGVGKVAAQPVALNGGRVVGWGAHQSGGWHDWGWDGGHDSAGSGGQGRGKDSDEGLHFRLSFFLEKMPFRRRIQKQCPRTLR